MNGAVIELHARVYFFYKTYEVATNTLAGAPPLRQHGARPASCSPKNGLQR